MQLIDVMKERDSYITGTMRWRMCDRRIRNHWHRVGPKLLEALKNIIDGSGSQTYDKLITEANEVKRCN